MNCCDDFGHCKRDGNCPARDGTVTHDADGLTVTEWPPLTDEYYRPEPPTNHPWDWGSFAIDVARWGALMAAGAALGGFALGYYMGH
jgi:hypothetical protein